MGNSMVDTVKEIEDFINNHSGNINQSSLTAEFADKNDDVFDVTITHTRRERKTETAGFKKEEE